MTATKAAPVLFACLVIAGCGAGTTSAPSTVTVTSAQAADATAASTTTKPVAEQVTIPDVAGQNAEIAQSKLEKLGLTNVSLASANPNYSVVLLVRNWTVVGIEPAPGTVVRGDDPVVVKVTKP